MTIQFIVADLFEWEPPGDTSLVLCDPCYGTGKIFKSFLEGVPDLDDTDRTLPYRVLARLLEWKKPLAFFCAPEFPFGWTDEMYHVPPPERILVWKTSWISGFKSNSTLPRQVDFILCYNTKGRGVLKVDGKTVGALLDDDKLVSPVHKSFVKRRGGLPVEKGIGIGAVLTAAFSDPGDLVVDVGCGASGSLARGAATLDRRVIGIDIEPLYIKRAGALATAQQEKEDG